MTDVDGAERAEFEIQQSVGPLTTLPKKDVGDIVMKNNVGESSKQAAAKSAKPKPAGRSRSLGKHPKTPAKRSKS